jgi:hypothetical protein
MPAETVGAGRVGNRIETRKCFRKVSVSHIIAKESQSSVAIGQPAAELTKARCRRNDVPNAVELGNPIAVDVPADYEINTGGMKQLDQPSAPR